MDFLTQQLPEIKRGVIAFVCVGLVLLWMVFLPPIGGARKTDKSVL